MSDPGGMGAALRDCEVSMESWVVVGGAERKVGMRGAMW